MTLAISFKRRLGDAIAASIQASQRSQRSAAALCGISQPRLNALLRGRLELFSIESLLGIAQALGCEISFSVQPTEKPQSMQNACRIPLELQIAPEYTHAGCEDEFRFA